MIKLRVTALLLASALSPLAFADNWQPITGADALRDMISGAVVEVGLKAGVTSIATYSADGTAVVKAWGETFQRTWEIVGDDQVCYTDIETKCFTLERNPDDPGALRATDVESGEVFMARVSGSAGAEFIEEAASAGSEGALGEPSAAEVAAALLDPNSTMGTLNFNLDYVSYKGDIPGAGSADAWRMVFQPVLPYSLSDTSNFFVRPAIPVIFSQDVPQAGGGFSSEGVDLGDIGFDVAVGKTLPGGIVVLGGVVGALPTATNDALGLDQWLLGPEFAIAKLADWGVVGVLLTHQWDIAGDDDFDTSITGGQYSYAFNLKNGWQIFSAPTFSYNHEASSGNKWTLPVGIGVSKTSIISGRPWKFSAQYWQYVKTPDNFGPDFQLRFTVTPVVSLPW
jgi:hypothetical protein